MSERAPPTRPAGGPGGDPGVAGPARAARARRDAQGLDGLSIAIAGLIRRIDAVWNETPETLAMLADWSDTLEAQRRDLEDWQRSVGVRPIRESFLQRTVREAVLDLALLGRLGRRLRQVAQHGERLRAAQAGAAARAQDPARRAMLERHHARTERHLARLRERLHPGR